MIFLQHILERCYNIIVIRSRLVKLGNLLLVPVIIIVFAGGILIFALRFSSTSPAKAAPVADFKVQRRCETPATGTTAVTLTAGTDYTAPNSTSSAFIRLVSTRGSGMGNTVGGGLQEADDWTWYISDPDFTGGSVTFSRAGATNPQRFCWEIVEYVGKVGGSNEMIVRSVGTATYSASSLTVSGNSVGVLNDNDVLVFITGQNSVETSAQEDVAAGQSTAEWDATNNIPKFTRGTTRSDANSLSYAVVELTGSNWGVERIEHQFTSSGATETVTTTDVGSTNRAFFHYQFRRSDYNQSVRDSGAEVWLSSNIEASFRLESGVVNPGNKYAVIWIVRNSDVTAETKMNVQHLSGSRTTAAASEGANNEEDEWTHTITAVSDLTQTSIMGESGRSAGSTNQYPRGWISLIVTTTTGVKLYQSDDGETQTYRFQVVEWPKSEPVTAITQSGYRFFSNLNETGVGAALADQNSSTTLGATGAAFRLRMLLHISDKDLSISGRNLQLQFSKQGNNFCDTSFSGEAYTVVTTSTVIAFNDNSTPADNSLLTASSGDPTHGTDAIVNQTYKELNTFTNSSIISAGKDGLWDFSLKDNSAPGGTAYCFRGTASTSWTISGSGYESVSYNDSRVTSNSELTDLAFNSDGSRMYVLYGVGVLDQYNLGTPWNLKTVSYDTSYQNFTTDYGGGNDAKPASFFFGDNGSKMYIVDSNHDKVFQYSLTTSWDVRTLSYSNASSSISSQTPNPTGIAFSNTGNKMYISSLVALPGVYQYTLAAPWNVLTAAYDGVFMWTGNGSAATDVGFDSNGTEMYVGGGGPGGGGSSAAPSFWRRFIAGFHLFSRRANAFGGGGAASGLSRYSLSTAWDISTAKYKEKFDNSGLYPVVEAIVWDGDGSRMFLLGWGSDSQRAVYQYLPATTIDTYSVIPEVITRSTSYGDLVQKSYRWYKDVNTKNPANEDSLAPENTKIDNLATNRKRHLRTSVESPNGYFLGGGTFKLQYQKTATTGSWIDVGSGAFSGGDFSCCADGETISTLRLSGSDVLETYEENGTSAATPNTIGGSEIGEWNWAIKSELSADSGATYYFRMIGSDGTALRSYENYPALSISSTGSSSHGELTSIIYDTGISSGAQLNSFFWNGPQPQTGDAVYFQFASASTTNPTGGWASLFKGPDGTATTWYVPSGPNVPVSIAPGNHKSHRYFRYKIRLESISGISPVVNRIIVNWSP